MSDEFTTTDVEVELHEILNFGHEYEYFVDLLVDKVIDKDGVNNEDAALCIHEYALVSVSSPNVGVFRCRWWMDELQEPGTSSGDTS